MKTHHHDLWAATRAPLSVLAVAVVGIGIAFALDQTSAREHALTIGAPSLMLLLPLGLVWLGVALILHWRRRTSATRCAIVDQVRATSQQEAESRQQRGYRRNPLQDTGTIALDSRISLQASSPGDCLSEAFGSKSTDAPVL